MAVEADEALLVRADLVHVHPVEAGVEVLPSGTDSAAAVPQPSPPGAPVTWRPGPPRLAWRGMRIGLSGSGNLDRVADQVAKAEQDGFASMWFAGAIGTDPLAVIAVAGRTSDTERIEYGTSVVQTYTRHPVLMAQQAAVVAQAVGPGRFTLGLGVSHQQVVESLGYRYDRPAVHMREYLTIVGSLLRGEPVKHKGEHYRVRADPRARPPGPVPILVAALGPVMLQVAGELADGTITWMANRHAIERHVVPRITRAAATAGRDAAPRVVVGLPVAVCDPDEGREAAAEQFAVYGQLPNYQRILEHGGISSPAEAAIVGDEAAVADQLRALVEGGATDVWAAVFPVGDDREGSRRRTRALLRDLAAA